MTVEELAEKLDGNIRGKEISKELQKEAKQSGLVVAFVTQKLSTFDEDFRIRLRGSINSLSPVFAASTDRFKTILFNKKGFIKDRGKCKEGHECPYFRDMNSPYQELQSQYHLDFDFGWKIEVKFWHETFVIVDPNDKVIYAWDDDRREEKEEVKFCQGIVFNMKDLKE